MEQNGILNPTDEKCMFALHYVFVNRINRSLKQFREAWNSHGLRTERGQTPNQLFTTGLLRLRYSGLDAADMFELVEEGYGQVEDGIIGDDDEGVSVPQLLFVTTQRQLSEIQETVDPLSDDDEYGIRLYTRVLEILDSP